MYLALAPVLKGPQSLGSSLMEKGCVSVGPSGRSADSAVE